MTKYLLAAAICCVASVCLAESDAKWKKIVNEDEGFTISFPAEPKETEHGYTLEMMDGNAVFIVDVRENDTDIEDDEKVTELFDAAEKALLASLKDAKVLSKKDMTFQKEEYAKRVYDLDTEKLLGFKSIYRAHFICTGEQFFQVVVLGPTEFVEGKDVEKFLKSFKVAE